MSIIVPKHIWFFSRFLFNNKSQINHFPSAVIFASGVYGSSPPHRDESISRKISIVPKIAPSEPKWFVLNDLEIEKWSEVQGVVYFTRIEGKFVGVRWDRKSEWWIITCLGGWGHIWWGATRKEPHFGRPPTCTLPT